MIRKAFLFPAAALLVAAALTGCRAGAQAAGTGSAGGTTPVAGSSTAGGAAPAHPVAGSSTHAPVSADLSAIEEDLSGIQSAGNSVGSDLSGAAADAAQPDNG